MPSSVVATRDLQPGQPFALVGGLVLDAGDPIEGAVIVQDGRIVAIETALAAARLPVTRLEGVFVAPGFVDVQVNGGFGYEVGRDPSALRALCENLPRTGVTSFLPTLISARADDYPPAFAAFETAQRAPPPRTSAPTPTGARMEGLHLEGPLLALNRSGAHDPTAIAAADVALLDRLADPALVRLITLAPERDGARALIARLVARGLTVALGHTDASFAQFTAGVDAGATAATHLFNAMTGLHHREPGAAGAALTDDRVTAFMIADGVHTHPAIFLLASRAKGATRLGLVTDAVAGAGLGPGLSRLGGREVRVDDVSARLDDGRLAGSTLTMDRAVRNAAAFAGLSAPTAIRMATAVPAHTVGLSSRGRLRVGNDADLVLLDAQLNVQATFVGGALAYGRDV